jgi:hypothetical protein
MEIGKHQEFIRLAVINYKKVVLSEIVKQWNKLGETDGLNDHQYTFAFLFALNSYLILVQSVHCEVRIKYHGWLGVKLKDLTIPVSWKITNNWRHICRIYLRSNEHGLVWTPFVILLNSLGLEAWKGFQFEIPFQFALVGIYIRTSPNLNCPPSLTEQKRKEDSIPLTVPFSLLLLSSEREGNHILRRQEDDGMGQQQRRGQVPATNKTRYILGLEKKGTI